MVRLVIVFGLLLVLLGLFAYFILADPDQRSVTALIPAMAGVPILICGLIGVVPAARKHAMHVAMLFGLLGAIAPWGRLVKSFQDGFEFNEKTGVQLGMSLLCALMVVLGVFSFIKARRGSTS